MDAQVTAVLSRRIASLERVIGAISDSNHIASNNNTNTNSDDGNVGNTIDAPQPPLEELRALDRHLTELIPEEYTHALATLRAYRQSLARTYVLECKKDPKLAAKKNVRGIWEIRELKQTLDDTHQLESLLCCTTPLRKLQNSANLSNAQALKDQEKIDQLLSQYNASIAYSNASILRLAAVIREL